jgi:hypothetical protein
MARKSVDVNELMAVDANSLLQSLSQENAALRLENLAQKTVIDRMKNYIESLSENKSEEFE